jgi:hypothetical protein
MNSSMSMMVTFQSGTRSFGELAIKNDFFPTLLVVAAINTRNYIKATKVLFKAGLHD